MLMRVNIEVKKNSFYLKNFDSWKKLVLNRFI
jgi:hypothetical protein